ncbi:hypothetical protein [Arthrobacter sp. NicSoilC12]|uniref:hypothetical protein n=1 Tax=Arthrobacter sp. NicSoilC12 TaxID=2831001 RepID=UPI002089199A|nr:hypothetical protein NicSoilC12_26770 [Arthrobacter sp. NicSoilC12]
MTQNPWAQAAPEASPDRYAGVGVVPPQGTGRADSKQEAAKDEAADVTRHAAGAAQNVAETAKTEAANVASEVKTNARDLLHQAKSDLTEQAGTQQQKVAEGLRSVAGELHSMAAASDQPGVATDLVRQAAERSSAVASWLDGRDPGSLLTEVKSFARQRPGTFLLLAAGAGVLAGRLSRSLSAGAPETTGATATGTSAAGRIPDTGGSGSAAAGTDARSTNHDGGPRGHLPAESAGLRLGNPRSAPRRRAGPPVLRTRGR